MAAIKVFISWSGEKSKAVAGRINKWLKSIIPEVETFFSPEITGGNMWLTTIAGQLQKADFTILCISKDNWKSSWINFEAGALWRGIGNVPICPVIIEDMDELKGPLSIFQARKFDEDDMKGLCRSIAQKTGLVELQFDQNFEVVWPQLSKEVSKDFENLETNYADSSKLNIYGIKILTPLENFTGPNPIEIEGTYESKPPDKSIWVLEYDNETHLFWPKHFIPFIHSRKWHTGVSIGGKPGEKKVVYIVEAGIDGRIYFEYSRRIYKETGKWPGMDNLTSDIKFLTSVVVIKGDGTTKI